MRTTAKIIGQAIGVSITVIILIAAAVWGCQNRPTDAPCVSLEYIIVDRGERLYLSERELTTILQSEHLYPVGRPLDVSLLHRIEATIREHPMVRTAECYVTPSNEVKIRLTQRIPLLRVQMPGDHYLIDTDRRVMQARESVCDTVLLVTGTLGAKTAAGQLADFAEWIQLHRYWQQRIIQVHMRSPQMAVLYVRGNKPPRVVLGSFRDYERKLNKLRTFMENSAEITQDKDYYELDIRYKGQVIGRK